MRMSAPCPVVLVSPYELGRQPFALAQPAAWLRESGFEVRTIDLSLERLTPEKLADARLVAISLGMHTATRIALAALPKIRALAPYARLAAFGLYAPVNESRLRAAGITHLFGGESEPDLVDLAQAVHNGEIPEQRTARVHTDRIDYRVPDRRGLAPLERYARLRLTDGREKRVGFVETTRGCKHLCRHCPVVPVYHGRFTAIPAEIVLADIDQQVAMGAEHLSFGDPDFLNGPTHARRIVKALHERHPRLTFDATIKIEHLVRHADLLDEFADSGCLLIISAVESVDDAILERIAKGHTRADFEQALALTRRAGIALSPTFVPFTPWTTMEGYLELLHTLVRLSLANSVAPIQLVLRLLIPAGSTLMELDAMKPHAGPYDPAILGHPWRHPDPRLDALQLALEKRLMEDEHAGRSREAVFETIWEMAHETAGRTAPPLPASAWGQAIPHHTEPWYCCAEPTQEQISGF